MLTATIMRPGHRPEVRELAEGWTLTSPVAWGMLRDMLDGGDPERVNVFHEGAYTDMLVAESSGLNGLPRNEAATAIYRCNWLTHQDPKADPESLPAVYGPAVLFSRKVWF